jgi:hypothetical protein
MAELLPKDDGYRGIWYNVGDKYSGGLGTYPQQIRPFAIYSKEANKTFFTWGGRPKEKNTLLHMVSYYDHETGLVPRPTILLDKQTKDAHDNPCIAVDDRGYIWIFSNTHGAQPRSSIRRSTEPYSIDSFEPVLEEASFSYGQPWFLPGAGFMFIHNRYQDGRAVAFMTSRDGREWSEPQLLAQMAGHYQISFYHGNKVGVAFNYHHERKLDQRTNLYYLESSDFGKSWTTAAGDRLEVPLKDVQTPAMVVDELSNKRLVYLKDVQFDEQGRPVLVYLTSGGHGREKENDPRIWHVARWTGEQWAIHEITQSDHNYDFGQLYIEQESWRLIAPTTTGPQAYMTGGEVAVWSSTDQGATWKREKQLTRNSPRNHTYIRRPTHAHPDFYAFWADGNAAEASESFLYFTNKALDQVWRLPEKMEQDFGKPQLIGTVGEPARD